MHPTCSHVFHVEPFFLSSSIDVYMCIQLRKTREQFDRAQRHEMAEISSNSLKHKKLQRNLEADATRDALANNAQHRQLFATIHSSRNSQERAIASEMTRLKTASLRAEALDKRMKEKAQAGRIGSYDSPYAFNANAPETDDEVSVRRCHSKLLSCSLFCAYKRSFSLNIFYFSSSLFLKYYLYAQPDTGTLNALLRSAGLTEYLAAMEERGCTRPEDLGKLSVADVQGMVRPLLGKCTSGTPPQLRISISE